MTVVPPKSPPFLQVAQTSKVYGKGAHRTVALAPIDFTLEHGQFVAITGPSGVGKTTLLNLLAGIERPSTGTVEFGGRPLAAMSDEALLKWRAETIGFVFQSYDLISVLNARENVELPAHVHGYARGERRDRAMAALRLVDMVHRQDHLPAQLSGGERQRVALARAVMAGAPLLLCDEPTGNLDAANADAILELLVLLNREYAKTIVLVTHDLKAAERASRRLHLEKN